LKRKKHQNPPKLLEKPTKKKKESALIPEKLQRMSNRPSSANAHEKKKGKGRNRLQKTEATHDSAKTRGKIKGRGRSHGGVQKKGKTAGAEGKKGGKKRYKEAGGSGGGKRQGGMVNPSQHSLDI